MLLSYFLSLLMKKILILGFALILGISSSFAQATDTKSVLKAPVTSASAELENIAKSIDRRIIFFNKYIKAKDMESIKGLVSEENKDFYTNFLKYIETAPVFTVKRDTSLPDQGIIKTPQNEYTFPALLSLG